MEWLVAHRRAVIGALGSIAVVAAAFWGYTAWRSSREFKAGTALSEALDLGARPIASEAPPQPGQETFPSKEEREKAVIAALTSVRAGHGGTAAALTAPAAPGFRQPQTGASPGAPK